MRVYILLVILSLNILLTSCSSLRHNTQNPKTIPTFVISLDRTPERYDRVQKMLDRADWPHERFVATDGYKLTMTDQSTAQTINGQAIKSGLQSLKLETTYQIHCNDQIKPTYKTIYTYQMLNGQENLTLGEFGCYCSHLRVWQHMIDQNIQMALILEDDVTVSLDISDIMQQLFKSLPVKWDIVSLYTTTSFPVKAHKNINNILSRYVTDFENKYYSTAAYIITLSAAKKMLYYTQKINQPIDWMIDKAINDNSMSVLRSNYSVINVTDEMKAQSVINSMKLLQ